MVIVMEIALLIGVLLMMTGLTALALGFVTAYVDARKGWQR